MYHKYICRAPTRGLVAKLEGLTAGSMYHVGTGNLVAFSKLAHVGHRSMNFEAAPCGKRLHVSWKLLCTNYEQQKGARWRLMCFFVVSTHHGRELHL